MEPVNNGMLSQDETRHEPQRRETWIRIFRYAAFLQNRHGICYRVDFVKALGM
jgi:hypothetical protein